MARSTPIAPASKPLRRSPAATLPTPSGNAISLFHTSKSRTGIRLLRTYSCSGLSTLRADWKRQAGFYQRMHGYQETWLDALRRLTIRTCRQFDDQIFDPATSMSQYIFVHGALARWRQAQSVLR